MSPTRTPRPPWWTDADAAEFDALVWTLGARVAEHEARCPTCQALADPCPVRAAIAREVDAYDFAPLDAPRGFWADLRRRLSEHERGCGPCQLARPGHCRAVTTATAAVADWLIARRLLSRAEYLRRREEGRAA